MRLVVVNGLAGNVLIRAMDEVFCDLCNKDYTNDSASGGLVFDSTAVCPNCVPRLMQDLEKDEAHLIIALCPLYQPFADFIRAYRVIDDQVKEALFKSQ